MKLKLNQILLNSYFFLLIIEQVDDAKLRGSTYMKTCIDLLRR